MCTPPLSALSYNRRPPMTLYDKQAARQAQEAELAWEHDELRKDAGASA